MIHPFSGSARKNWPLERFRELAARLAMPVRWCAGPEEALNDAVRFENLYDLACWLSSARVYIGNDSGLTHLAAAVGVPVVAIFGPTDRRCGRREEGEFGGQREAGRDHGGSSGSNHKKWYSDAMRSTIDSAGRVVIPKAIREAAGLKPGSPLRLNIGTEGSRSSASRQRSGWSGKGPW